jgi:hypothetical protein
VIDPGRAPEFIRCDNGPELTAQALADWCKTAGAGTHYIDPGSPWQNDWTESFHSRLRDECLAVEELNSLLEAQIVIADWRRDYNKYRPHSARDPGTGGRRVSATPLLQSSGGRCAVSVPTIEIGGARRSPSYGLHETGSNDLAELRTIGTNVVDVRPGRDAVVVDNGARQFESWIIWCDVEGTSSQPPEG